MDIAANLATPDMTSLLGDRVAQKAELAEARSAAGRTGKVGEEFESVFLSLMLKEMRKTLDQANGGLFSGDKSDTYGGMFDMFMAQSMAKSRPLGIADAVDAYMANRNLLGDTDA
jgi:flagellar protein FlgJ